MEVAVLIVVVFVFVGVVVLAIPRSRESARLATCRRNLMLIGQAVAYYDGATGHLPTVPAFDRAGTAPLPSMLGQLGLGNISQVADPKKKGSGLPGAPPPARVLPEFTCPSDMNVRGAHFPAPVSYRANTGGSTDGTGGPFAAGKIVSLADVEQADGQDFTASFAERLVGSGPGERSELADYQVVPGPVGDSPCPVQPESSWRTDAGSSWASPGWNSTLYNHATVPGASPSCVSKDGVTARIGVSSGHSQLVHALMLGGSVRTFTATVDPEVWRRFGNIKDAPAHAP